MEKSDPVIKAVDEGHPAIEAQGNIHDFRVSDNSIYYTPTHIAECLSKKEYVVLCYSFSSGLYVYDYSNLAKEIKDKVDRDMQAVGLARIIKKEREVNAEEVLQIMRDMSRLLQIKAKEGIRYVWLIQYLEHLAPDSQSANTGANETTIVAETLHSLNYSIALRKSENCVICLTRSGLQNKLLNDLYKVVYAHPSEEEIINFTTILIDRMEGDNMNIFSKELNLKNFAKHAKGEKLKQIEELVKIQRTKNTPFTIKGITEHKSQSILKSSEGTLSIMSTDMTLNQIVGLKVIKRVIAQFSELLKSCDPRSPRALLFAGPFGVGKSTFAPILGELCGFNIVQFELIKDKFVGETERRIKLALSLLQTLSPVILFIDEITEMTPSRKSEASDGGVSQNILGELFQFFARDDLRGKVLLIAATNVPERLDPAWIDRFLVLPFLELQPAELCQFVCLLEKQLTKKQSLDPNSPKLIEACTSLYQKGISPRKMRDVFNHAVMSSNELTEDVLLQAAQEYAGETNPYAVAYASLNALALTSFTKYYPWSLNPGEFTYPWYLADLVNEKTGEINREGLYKRIDEYRKYIHF